MGTLRLQRFSRVYKQATNGAKVLPGKRLNIQYALIVKSHPALLVKLSCSSPTTESMPLT